MRTNNKLREALAGLLDVMHDMGIDEDTVAIAVESKHCCMHSKEHLDAIKKAKAALAEPVKNCEVGTAEEQWKRYSDFTNKYTPCAYKGSARCTEDCPVNKKLTRDGHGTLLCPFEWAQMHYESEATDGN